MNREKPLDLEIWEMGDRDARFQSDGNGAAVDNRGGLMAGDAADVMDSSGRSETNSHATACRCPQCVDFVNSSDRGDAAVQGISLQVDSTSIAWIGTTVPGLSS